MQYRYHHHLPQNKSVLPSRRDLVFSAAACALLPIVPVQAKLRMRFRTQPAVAPPSGESIAPIKLGAGGYVSGLNISDADATPNGGLMVCRFDTYGGAKFNRVTRAWESIITPTSVGTSLCSTLNCYEIVVDHRNDNYIYAWIANTALANVFNLLRSTNSGASWEVLNLKSAGAGLNAQVFSYRQAQGFIDVDPFNSDCMLIGTSQAADSGAGDHGLYFSNNIRDATPSFTKQTSVSDPIAAPGTLVRYDRSGGSTTVGGQVRCKRAWAVSCGNGAWLTDDGCQTWTQMSDGAGLGGPIDCGGMDVIQSGTYAGTLWLGSDFHFSQGPTKTWKWTVGGGWVAPVYPVGYTYAGEPIPGGICAVDQTTANSGTVIFIQCYSGAAGYSTARTTDNGVTFTNDGSGTPLALTAAASWTTSGVGDIPFMAVCYIPVVGMTGTTSEMATACFDPLTPGRIIVPSGVGCWYCDYPTDFSSFEYKAMGAGTELLIACNVSHPVGAPEPVCAVQDRGIVTPGTGDTYATTYWGGSAFLCQADAGVQYASNDPSFMVSGIVAGFVTPFISYSTSYGSPGTWATFSTQPYGVGRGGWMAAWDANNILYQPGTSANATITASILLDVMTVTAVSGNVLTAGQMLTGAGVDPKTEIVAQLSGSGGLTGTYQVSISQTVASESMYVGRKIQYTTDGGATWNICAGIPNDSWQPSFAQPYRACAADRVTAGTYYCMVKAGAAPGFYRSTDYGANWTLMAAMSSIYVGGLAGEYMVNSITGHAGHVLVSQFADDKARFTPDGGANWYVAGLAIGYTSPGPNSPTTGYPRVWANQGDYIVYCDDVNISATGGTPTWTQMSDTLVNLANTTNGVRNVGANMNSPYEFYLSMNGEGVYKGTVTA